MSSVFHTLDTFNTQYSPDSVEWCPMESHRNIFVCGTYHLQEEGETDSKDRSTDRSLASKRLGIIYLMKVLDRGKLKLVQQLEESAILDMKWSQVPLYNKILLGVVTSKGQLNIYHLNENDQILEVITDAKISGNSDILALSLDWCTGQATSTNTLDSKIIVSDSKGQISLYTIQESGLKKSSTWNAHEYEAWISAFDYWDTNRVYTGGDDCKLKCFDIRIGGNHVACNSIHCAGITSLHSNAKKEFLLASGSYDEILRLWDVRYFKKTISETNLGGGIWRLKWDPLAHRYLLAACMYNGFKIIDCQNAEIPYIIGKYNEHTSISYGCDWSLLKSQEIFEHNISVDNKKDTRITATCSFYDHQLKMSTVCLNFM